MDIFARVVPKILRDADTNSKAVIIDIRSGSVVGAIVHDVGNSKRKKPTIGYTTRATFLAHEINSPEGAKAIEQAVAVISRNITTAGARKTQLSGSYHVHIVVHAPWSTSRIRTVSAKLQKETIVDKEIIQRVMSKHELPPIQQGFEVYEQHTSRIALNGYPTDKPYKESAKHISVDISESCMPTILLDSIERAIVNFFPNHFFYLHPFSKIAEKNIHHFFNLEDFTVIDISETKTNIAAYYDHMLKKSSVQDFGVETLIDNLSKKMKSPKEHVVSLLELYVNEKCTPAQCKDIEQAAQTANGIWADSFGKACTDIVKDSHLPANVLLIAPTSLQKWFAQSIERIDFGQFTITRRPFEVRSATFKDLVAHVYLEKEVRSDITIGFITEFIDTYTH